jgi:hypothetical protein
MPRAIVGRLAHERVKLATPHAHVAAVEDR